MITSRNYPWIAEQDWSNILFMHWPVPVEKIEPFIPKAFVIDTFADSAWVSIVIFQAKNSRLRYSPKQLVFPSVTQINVRTYVASPCSKERGVYFFGLYAKSIFAVFGANRLFGLPFRYLHTDTIQENNNITIIGKANNEEELCVQYRPLNKIIQNELAHFLTERYCIWNVKGQQIIKIPILHTVWDLQKVEIDMFNNTFFTSRHEAYFSRNPVVHYSSCKRAKLFPYERCGFIH